MTRLHLRKQIYMEGGYMQDNREPLFYKPKNNWNWGLLIILILCAYYWVNVYWYGFFIPTIWTIVIASIIGLYLRLSGKA